MEAHVELLFELAEDLEEVVRVGHPLLRTRASLLAQRAHGRDAKRLREGVVHHHLVPCGLSLLLAALFVLDSHRRAQRLGRLLRSEQLRVLLSRGSRKRSGLICVLLVVLTTHEASRAALLLPRGGHSSSPSLLHHGDQVVVAAVVQRAQASRVLSCVVMEASQTHHSPRVRRLPWIALRALLVDPRPLGPHDRASVQNDTLVRRSLVRVALHSL